MPTVTLTFDAPARRKSTAVAVVYGPTVDDPSATMSPRNFFRLYVGFLTDTEPTATEASTRQATTPTDIAAPRRSAESLIVCAHSSRSEIALEGAIVAACGPEWGEKE